MEGGRGERARGKEVEEENRYGQKRCGEGGGKGRKEEGGRKHRRAEDDRKGDTRREKNNDTNQKLNFISKHQTK